MRQNTPSSFLNSTRQISARVKRVRNNVSFERANIGEYAPGTPIAYDAKLIGSTYHRVAIFNVDGMKLYTCNMTTPGEARYWNYAATIPEANLIPGYPYSLAIRPDGQVMVGCAGKQLIYTGSGFVENPAPVSADITSISSKYVFYMNTDSYDYQVMSIYNFESMDEVTSYVPRINAAITARVAGDCLTNARELVFFDNPTEKTIQFFPVYQVPTSGSPKRGYGFIEDLIPIDLVDDEDRAQLINVDMLGNKPVITFRLKRRNGGHYIFYSVGPNLNDPFSRNSFSMGRNSIIDEVEDADPVFGGMWFHPSGANFIGYGYGYASNPSEFLGYNPETVVCDFSKGDVTMSVNTPGSISLAVSPDLDVECGDDLFLEISESGNWTGLASFNVDSVNEESSDVGTAKSITATSSALKKMAQWNSDSTFSYLSQDTAVGEAKDLTKFIRKTGVWETNLASAAQGLYLKDLNVDGIMYTAIPASRGGIVKAKFYKSGNIPNTVSFGVGLDFFEETFAECSIRIGMKLSDITTADTQKSGIFFRMRYQNNGTIDMDRSGVYYYDTTSQPLELAYKDDPGWTLLQPVGNSGFGTAFSVSSEIMMTGTDGLYTAYVRSEGMTKWSTVCSCAVPKYILNTSMRGIYSNERDYYGRGVLFVRNDTPHVMAHGIGFDGNIIGYYPDPSLDTQYLPTSGQVKIDDEILTYTTKKEIEEWGALYKNGVVAIDNTFSTGTEVPVSSRTEKDNAYARQIISIPEDITIQAIDLYVKKIGYPDDGLEISIRRGPGTGSNPLGTVLTTTVISANSILDTGGVVHVGFPSKVLISSGDWLIINRYKDPAHPNTSNYYELLCRPTQGGHPSFDFFADATDSWETSVGGTSYADKELSVGILKSSTTTSVNGAWVIHLANEVFHNQMSTSYFNQTTNYYVNSALCITNGPGVGNSYKVVGSAFDTLPIIYIDKDPGTLFETDKTFCVLSNAISGLTRGEVPAAHTEGTAMDVYSGDPMIEVGNAEFYSSDKDITVQDMIDEVAMKSGSGSVKHATLVPSLITNGQTFWVQRRNVILDFLHQSSNEVTLTFRSSLSGSFSLTFYGIELIFKSNGTTLEIMDLFKIINDDAPVDARMVRVSLVDKKLSVWGNGRPLWSTTLLEADAAQTGSMFSISSTGPDLPVSFPEASYRLEYFNIDMNSNGYQSLSTAIGNRKIFFREGIEGLDVFMNRMEVGSQYSSYTLANSHVVNKTDIVLSRVLIEGVGLAEKANMPMVRRRGNIFLTKNVPEAISDLDAIEFAQFILDEEAYSETQVQFTGALDPRLECGDISYVRMKNGSIKAVIADTINYAISTSENGVVLDMSVTGREKA